MQIIKPNEKYLMSYLDGCKSLWNNVHDRYIIHNPDDFDDWKTHIFEDYNNAEFGINLPQCFLPNVTFWMVDEDNYIGTLNIRLKLNDTLKKYGGHFGFVVRPEYRGHNYSYDMSKFAIQFLHDKNIYPIMISTFETNIGARHIIEKLNPNRIEKDILIQNGKSNNIIRCYFE